MILSVASLSSVGQAMKEAPGCLGGANAMTDAPQRSALPVARAPRGTLQDHVYRQLRELILNGEIAPGQLITIQALAEAFGVSAMPVREALQRLTAARVLTVISSRSIGIPPLTGERLSDLRRVRLEVESLAAIWATQNMSDSDIGRLEECVTAMDQAARARSILEFIRPRAPRRFSRSSRLYGCRLAPTFTCSTLQETISKQTSSTNSCLPPSGLVMERKLASPCAATSRPPTGCLRRC
jgi:DNA-binding GntR family transcriptional regulator